MISTGDSNELRSHVLAWRAAGERIAFVPTMGNLHAGHLALIKRARQKANRVVASIYVNPTQFGADEDLASYPRTLIEDQLALEQARTDLLFMPDTDTMYPYGLTQATHIEVPELGKILCGIYRPVHFAGVTQVVAKLFNLVQPHLAVFGEKDFQQLVIIQHMTRDLCLPIAILGEPTVREDDGLAMSSRNGYLDKQERTQAPILYKTLCELANAIQSGSTEYAVLEQAAMQQLKKAGFLPEYISVRQSCGLSPAKASDTELVILAAAWLGQRTRLIDNLRVILK